MTVINIRGTSGSGKSTLVRAVMSYYPIKKENNVEGRLRPLSYTLSHPDRRPLEVLGHYESPCGGCDTIKSLDQIFGLVEAAHDKGHDVIFEGMLLCSDVKRSVALSQKIGDFAAISLTTPVHVCLDNIRKRREAKGNTKPLLEANTIKRYDYEQKQVEKLKAAGVNIKILAYPAALSFVQEAFGCTP